MAKPRKPKGKITVFDAYTIDLDRGGALERSPKIDTSKAGDYGCDPIGGGMFRMVPSGEIVDTIEMHKRLGRPTIRGYRG